MSEYTVPPHVLSDTQVVPIERDSRFLAQLKRHEGTKKKGGLHIAYRCPAGALTIGYGHNLDANPVRGVNAKSALTEEEAMALLVKDVSRFASQLDTALPWWRELSAPRAATLLNMAFNMGVGKKATSLTKGSGLLSFKNTLVAIREGRWDDARFGMLNSKWSRDVGRRAVELARQMLTGEWQTGVKV